MKPDTNAQPDIPQMKILSGEEIQQILAVVFAENPTLAPVPRNAALIGDWLDAHYAAEISLDTVRTAIKVLSYPVDKFERQKPPVPVAPQPVAVPEPVEVLAPGEISIYADQFTLKHASPAQLRSYIKRAKAANAKK